MWILPFIITVPPMEANIGKLFEWHGLGSTRSQSGLSWTGEMR